MTNQEQKQNTVLQCFQITLQLSLEILEAFSATEIPPKKYIYRINTDDFGNQSIVASVDYLTSASVIERLRW